MKGLVGMIVWIAAAAVTAAFGAEAQCGKIVYVQSNIPSLSVPPVKGKFITTLVPDTLDIAERAELAINGLVGPTNPGADYELYWWVDINRNPPVMCHELGDWCGIKFMEALPLLRMMTGSERYGSVDQLWMDVTLKSIGPDGLYYIPLTGRPWARKGMSWGNGFARADGTIADLNDPSVSQFTHPYVCGRIMSEMTVFYLRDKNPLWLQMMQKMVDRLCELAIEKDDYCYFPELYFEPNAKYDKNSPMVTMPQGLNGGEVNGRVSQGLAQFYRITEYKPARELAEKLTRFIRFHDNYFDPNGAFTGDKHFHAHAIYLLSMLEYGVAVNDKELIDFVRKSYKWAKMPVAGSSSLIGFFPEYARPDYLSSEGCAIADMIALALKLSAAGAGDFYDDAERWTRNHFAESQLTKCDWIYRTVAQRPKTQVGKNETADRVPERNIGAFAGWSGASDWHIQGSGIMHCCTGNCARALYYIWEDILSYKDGVLRINMLLNLTSKWADVQSYIPYEGQVDIIVKKDSKRVLVHVPEWIDTNSLQLIIEVDGKTENLHMVGPLCGYWPRQGKKHSGS